MAANPPFTAAFICRFLEDFVHSRWDFFGIPAELVVFVAFLPLCWVVWQLTAMPTPPKGLVQTYVSVQ
jgi:hypothetical protein